MPIFTQTGEVNLTTGFYSSYQWFLNGGIISGAIDQTYTAITSGNYTVQVYSVELCAGTSDPVTVTTAIDCSVGTPPGVLTASPLPNGTNVTLTWSV